MFVQKISNFLAIPGPRVADSEDAHDGDEELEEEYEEEDHEVEGGVVAEGLVGGPEPADEGDGREEDEVEERQPEGLPEVAAGEQVEEPDDHVREVEPDVR